MERSHQFVFDPVSATKTGYRIFVKFGVGFRYKKLCGESDFRENRLTNIRSLLRNVFEILPVNFHVYLRILTRFDNQRSFCYAAEKFEKFVKNQWGETGCVSKGVNRILSVFCRLLIGVMCISAQEVFT
jgi:hypothetical protein